MNKSETEKLNINVSDAVKELTIRHGEAPVLREALPLKITGDINTPANFVAKRKKLITDTSAHVIVDIEKQKISLVVDESSHYRSVIEGRMEIFPDLDTLQINGNKLYNYRQLYNALKFMGMYLLQIKM